MLVFSIALAFAGVVSASAQSQSLEPSKLRFLFLDERPGAYSLKAGSVERKISSAPYAISPPITVPPGGRFEIYQTSDQLDPATGKKIQIKVASIAPPSSLTSALVVVAIRPPQPGATAVPAPDITYFDTSPASFPAGSVRVINVGRAQMGVQFNAMSAFVLQPGETRIAQPTPDAKDRVVARIAVSEGSDWRLISNKISLLRSDQRLTGVFVYSPSGRLHTYTSEELAEFGTPRPGHFWLTYSESVASSRP